MKFEDIAHVVPFEAPEDIQDIWAWAKASPEAEVPPFYQERWNTWYENQLTLQEQAAEVYAAIGDEPFDIDALLNGAASFPEHFGTWWWETICALPWSGRLEEAIREAEVFLGVRDGEAQESNP